MAKGYKIFPRSKKFQDNWDETFGNKPKATFENCVFTETQTVDEAMAQLFNPVKPNMREIKGITE